MIGNRRFPNITYLYRKFGLKSFWRQAEAFVLFEELKMRNLFTGEVIYAHEYSFPRNRYFVISHTIYLKLLPIDRTRYELIYPTTYCALYFDIDYNKRSNPHNVVVSFTNFIKPITEDALFGM